MMPYGFKLREAPAYHFLIGYHTIPRIKIQGVHKVFKQFKRFIDITTDVGNI